MSFALSDEDKKLKNLTRNLIEDAGGTEAAAAALRGRVGATQLGNYQNLAHVQVMPIDVLIRLTKVTGSAELLEEVAARCGYEIRRIGAAETSGCAVRFVTAVAKETNDALQALSLAMVDGAVDDADRARIQAELLDVARVASEGAAALAGGCQ